MRLTMLCLSGFELHSRWLPLVSVRLRSKKRGTTVKDRMKNGARIAGFQCHSIQNRSK